MYTDSHTHLNISPLLENRETHLQDFVDIWWVWLSLIWTNLEDSRQAIKQATSYELRATSANKKHLARSTKHEALKVGATIGIHPEFAWKVWIQESIQELELILQADANNRVQWKPNIIWIWEIGTDLHREEYRPFHKEQKLLFQAQCELARKYNLPIIIHSRDDFEGTFRTLKDCFKLPVTSNQWNQINKVYFHCRGYWPEELTALKDWEHEARGTKFFVGFCWNITYPKAQVLRDSFQYCLDHNINILLETDAPFLAPQAIRWQQNTPAQIIHSYQYISDYFNIELDKLKKMVYDNFMKLYYP